MPSKLTGCEVQEEGPLVLLVLVNVLHRLAGQHICIGSSEKKETAVAVYLVSSSQLLRMVLVNEPVSTSAVWIRRQWLAMVSLIVAASCSS